MSEKSPIPPKKLKEAVRRLMATKPQPREAMQFLNNEITETSDRATGIIGGTILEQGLEMAIATHFVTEESDKEKFFGSPTEGYITFDIKIRLAHALGVYGDLSKDDLLNIKNIRNLFAHAQTPINFETPEVKSLVLNMSILDRVSLAAFPKQTTTTKDKFIGIMSTFLMYFYVGHGDNSPIRYPNWINPTFFS